MVAPLWRDLHLDCAAALVVRRRVRLCDVFEAVAVGDAAAQALGVPPHDLDSLMEAEKASEQSVPAVTCGDVWCQYHDIRTERVAAGCDSADPSREIILGAQSVAIGIESRMNAA